MPDSDRSAVYAAERAAFDGTDLESVLCVDAVADRMLAVMGDVWWPGPAVEVRTARRDARSSNTRCDTDGTIIRLAAPQATVATGAHELAHALAGVEHGHDALFRRAYLDVLSVITNQRRLDGRGDLHVDQLEAAFAGAGLSVGQRAWPAPPQRGGPIAL